jgi:nucleoside-diphosphate-sugar epimerase
MKVLITGAGGFLGRGMVVPFVGRHELRLMDVAAFESPGHEVIVGSVADLATVRRAVQGCDAIVIAHMASRQAGSYETPEAPFDANVKGTANLFFAAVEEGIQRVVLVSSSGVVHSAEHGGRFLCRDLPFSSRGIYGLTKVCQEVIAEQYHREHGLRVAVLRLGYIVDGDAAADKYGKPVRERNWQMNDRRDIGGIALAALECEDLRWEIFYTMCTDESMVHADTLYTRRRLGWTPKYRFKELPPCKPMREIFGPDYP